MLPEKTLCKLKILFQWRENAPIDGHFHASLMEEYLQRDVIISELGICVFHLEL